jgi:hypothetical protein
MPVFNSQYKNLVIRGKKYTFPYKTDKLKELDALSKVKSVYEVKEKKDVKTVKKEEFGELTVKQLIEKIISLGGTPKSSNTKSELVDMLIELEG